MRVSIQKPLFPWDELEDHPALVTIEELLATIPDTELLEGLCQARGRGRDDYPVRVLWGVVVLTAVLRHRDFESCLGELRGNPSLQRLIGIEEESQIPNGWNVSRFLDVLGRSPHRLRLEELFNRMVERLGEVVKELGKQTAGDATALSARRLRRDAKEKKSQQEASSNPDNKTDNDKEEKEKIELDEHGLPQPSGGRKEYTDDEGRVVRVVEWFGYKLHLLVDVRHEVALAYRISSSKVGDNEVLPELVDQAKKNLPPGRIRTLAYDKAADCLKVHRKLNREGIKPVIENRSLGKDEKERMLPGHDGNSNIVYDEAGRLYCYDMMSRPVVRHRMAYIGHEPSRGTLKYRCPARHEGWDCPMSEKCNAGKKYGLTVRVRQEIDLRRFPSTQQATKQFERLYKGRTAVERVNGRLKMFWGADDGNVTGAARFHGQVGTVMVVHAAFATLLASLPRWDGTLGKLRLTPIAKALKEKLHGASGGRRRAGAARRRSGRGKGRRGRPRRSPSGERQVTFWRMGSRSAKP